MFIRSKARLRVDLSASRFGAFSLGLILFLIPTVPCLAQEGEATGGGGLFSINPGLVIWTWVIFGLLLVVLRKWAWGPILGALEAREKRIQEALDGAARERAEATKLLEEQRRELSEAREQAQHILADSRKAGEKVRAEMLEEARSQKDKIVGQAKDEIRRERDHAVETLRREAVDLSIAAAGRVLERELDTQENRRIVEDYLQSLAAQKEGDGAG